MSADATRALVLRHFAALRRHGSSSAAALEQLVQGLPPGPAREGCTLAARTLQSPGAAPADDFVRVLAHPTGAGEAADHLAASLEAKAEGRDALRSATLLFQLAFAVPVLSLSALGWLGPRAFFATLGPSLPFPTEVLLSLAEAMRWVGVPLALFAAWAVQRPARLVAPGRAAFERAARVLERATSSLPGDTADLGLSPVEQRLLLVLRTNHEPTALRTLGDELTREGRAAVANFRLWAPVVVGLYGLMLGAGVFALYLPIFAIAGSIK